VFVGLITSDSGQFSTSGRTLFENEIHGTVAAYAHHTHICTWFPCSCAVRGYLSTYTYIILYNMHAGTVTGNADTACSIEHTVGSYSEAQYSVQYR
jgi:hypothetical protein